MNVISNDETNNFYEITKNIDPFYIYYFIEQNELNVYISSGRPIIHKKNIKISNYKEAFNILKNIEEELEKYSKQNKHQKEIKEFIQYLTYILLDNLKKYKYHDASIKIKSHQDSKIEVDVLLKNKTKIGELSVSLVQSPYDFYTINAIIYNPSIQNDEEEGYINIIFNPYSTNNKEVYRLINIFNKYLDRLVHIMIITNYT